MCHTLRASLSHSHPVLPHYPSQLSLQALFSSQPRASELTCWICTGGESSATSPSRWRSKSSPAIGRTVNGCLSVPLLIHLESKDPVYSGIVGVTHCESTFTSARHGYIYQMWSSTKVAHLLLTFAGSGWSFSDADLVVAAGNHGDWPGSESWLFCSSDLYNSTVLAAAVLTQRLNQGFSSPTHTLVLYYECF